MRAGIGAAGYPPLVSKARILATDEGFVGQANAVNEIRDEILSK